MSHQSTTDSCPRPKRSIRDLDLEGRRVFIRTDFNVPIEEGRVVDDTRIRASLPTIELALDRKARVVVASHLGRPKGRRRQALSLRPVADRLSSLLAPAVIFSEDCVGAEAERKAEQLSPGQILLLENLRFHPGETENSPDFVRALAVLADQYVNDAFGTAHRAHASTVGVPQILGGGVAGLLLEKELEYLYRILSRPRKPVVAIFGGKKVADKIDVIENFLNLADSILLGGAMAFTFLKAQGKDVGSSLVEKDKLQIARDLMSQASSRGVTLKLPSDHVIAPCCQAGVETDVAATGGIPDGWMGLDIGPRAVQEFTEEISRAQTIVWNGPLGVFEIDEFSGGTLEVASAIAKNSALSVVGGGDSVSALAKAGVRDLITHISTGGGASLQFLAGKKLPGVEALTNDG